MLQGPSLQAALTERNMKMFVYNEAEASLENPKAQTSNTCQDKLQALYKPI